MKGGKGTATRTVRLLGGIFSYAVAHDYIPSNPRIGFNVYPDKKGECFLSTDELLRLGDTLRMAKTCGLPWVLNEGNKSKHRSTKKENRNEVVSPFVIAAIRLLMLTACRLGEILNLRWSEIDLENGFMNLPVSQAGAKTVLLSVPALGILNSLPRLGEYVISGANSDRPRSDLKRPWKRIKDHAGLNGVRLHDLRHTFASIGAAAGLGLGPVGKLLGHASPETTARYSHFADDPLRLVSENISDTVASAMNGEPNRRKEKKN